MERRDGWRYHEDYGIAIGYHYLGGHPNTPWELIDSVTNQWVSPQKSGDDPALVLVADPLSIAFSVLAAALTALVGRFSRTYLHKEPGFARFFVLLGLFAGGTQLVAYAGALEAATGQRVTGLVLHLPVAGVVHELAGS